MNLTIDGFACLGSFGLGAETLLNALEKGDNDAFSPQADVSELNRFIPPRALRQCDRFSRLALTGACLATEAAGLDPHALGNCGVVLASGYGPATPTFEFLDSLLDHGEAMASPLAFSLSVHNIPAAIIAKTLGVIGPCATICQYESSVSSGMLLARSWLAEGRVDRVLFGAVDEYTAMLESMSGRLVRERETNGARACRRGLPLSEGAAFFLLSRAGTPHAPRIVSVMLERGVTNLPDERDGHADGCLRFLSGAAPPGLRQKPGAIDGSAAYGNLPVAQALDCAAALAMLRKKDSGARAARCLCYAANTLGLIALAGEQA